MYLTPTPRQPNGANLDLLCSNANYAGYMYVETPAHPPMGLPSHVSAMCKTIDHRPVPAHRRGVWAKSGYGKRWKENSKCEALAIVHRSTRSNDMPRTDPPAMELRTFFLKASRVARRSSAASLLRGSDAFGSRKRNCGITSQRK